MEDNFVNEIVELYKQNNWREIVNNYYNHKERNKLLWVFPCEENLIFLGQVLKELKCANVLSIGCGSGLLEWIIIQATGIPVLGLEIDGAWWKCKYSPPTFIPLLLAQPILERDTKCILEKTDCLLFCYFNNREAFKTYMEHFLGKVLVVIGPGANKGVHTDPRPFDDVGEEWKLHKSQEVRNSGDFIAVYCKVIFLQFGEI